MIFQKRLWGETNELWRYGVAADDEDAEKRLWLNLTGNSWRSSMKRGINLTGEKIACLENQGYFIMSDKKYYFPEIIRFALGFKYKKGARPRVLSLLVR